MKTVKEFLKEYFDKDYTRILDGLIKLGKKYNLYIKVKGIKANGMMGVQIRPKDIGMKDNIKFKFKKLISGDYPFKEKDGFPVDLHFKDMLKILDKEVGLDKKWKQ